MIRVVSALFPFRAALDAVDAALNDAGGLGGALAHLAALTRRLGASVARARAAALRVGLRPLVRSAACSAMCPCGSASTAQRTAIRPLALVRRRRVRRGRRAQPRAHRAVGADPRRGALHARRAGRDAAPRRRGLGDRHRLRVRDPRPRARRPRSSGASRWATSSRGAWRNATLGYWVAAAAGGRGHGTDAARLICAFAFEHAGLHRVQPAVIPRNVRSIRVVEKAGFRREGRALRYLNIAGRWEDHEIFAMTLEDWEARRRDR